MMLGIDNVSILSGVIFGLLVGAYLLLWLCLSIIRQITVYRSRITEGNEIGTVARDHELRASIAAAAVAVALEIESETVPHEFPMPPTALVSAWQAVKRADLLKRHGGRPR